ncbi:MAG: efflux RND transporter periplasmic adaptor subunit [Steroidobacteraceae bacterium]
MPQNLHWKLIAIVAGLVVAGGGGVYWLTSRTPPVHYLTTAASRGDVATTITASGTVNPVVIVEVGTYVSGTIETLSCDFNTRVHKGQLCAKIDPKPYQVVVDQNQADLQVAQAQLLKDQANVVYTKVNHERIASLLSEDSASKDAADSALNAYDQSVALVALDAATIAQKRAALEAAQINLNYTNIVSPVEGTVVSRNVTAGQTVAASFQTPTLFLIATDLTKMQVDTNVSESDIAGAMAGVAAGFTVDAYPKATFQGRVAQVRQAPVSVQNVITYDVVIAVDNTALMLRPGMTATARIVTAQANNVLRVPAQALRFTPSLATKRAPGSPATAGQRLIWVERDGQVIAVTVTVGITDDTYAEIRSGDLKVGDQVITSEAAAGETKASATPALRL